MDGFTVTQTRAFVDAYLQLCEEHGLYITSCECCGGPFLDCVGKVREKAFGESREDYRETLLRP